MQIVPRMGYSADGVGNFVVLTLLTALGAGLYLQCVYADPGGPANCLQDLAAAEHAGRQGGAAFDGMLPMLMPTCP